ncbi:MAG: TolC family protein [Verrucomicrobiae bacterium]|nr:TolC family protein [Verrucomicrobiae bacterium]
MTLRLFIFLLVARLACVLPAKAEPPARVLTLEECVRRALAHNLDVRIEELAVAAEGWNVVREQAEFDPALFGNTTYRDSSQPLDPERAAALGLGSLESQTWRFETGFEGRLPTGTRYRLSLQDTRTEGTLAPEPVHVGAAAVSLTQPILRDFGLQPNLARLRVARLSRRMATEQWRALASRVLTDTQIAYFQLVHAHEARQAAVEDRQRAQRLLADTRRRAELGVVNRLEIVQAEAGVAAREEAVLVAEQTIREAENTLRRLMGLVGTQGAETRMLPAELPALPEPTLEREAALRVALEQRPDYQQLRHQVEREGVLVRFQRNQLWPQFDLVGSYGLNARANTFGDWTDNLGRAEDPEWAVGLVMRVPLGNRAARAEYQQARIREQQAQLALERLQQQIVLEVDNAIGRVRTNRQRVEATRAAWRLAEESLRAEEEKQRAGSSTSFLVLEAQSRLAQARAALIRAEADYRSSIVELAHAQGTAFEQAGIVLVE